MKPTNEQIRESWELIGFKHVNHIVKVEEGIFALCGMENDNGDRILADEESIDLNNLFKYAPEYQQIIFQPGYCGITKDDVLYEGIGDTEEDALFWALDKVRKSK